MKGTIRRLVLLYSVENIEGLLFTWWYTGKACPNMNPARINYVLHTRWRDRSSLFAGLDSAAFSRSWSTRCADLVINWSSEKSKPCWNFFHLMLNRWTELCENYFLRPPAEDFPLSTMKELEKAILSMINKKELGPSGILAEMYKLVFHAGR